MQQIPMVIEMARKPLLGMTLGSYSRWARKTIQTRMQFDSASWPPVCHPFLQWPVRRRLAEDQSRSWHWLGAFVVLRGLTQDVRPSRGNLSIRFIQPTSGTAQYFTYQRLRLSRSFDRPL